MREDKVVGVEDKIGRRTTGRTVAGVMPSIELILFSISGKISNLKLEIILEHDFGLICYLFVISFC